VYEEVRIRTTNTPSTFLFRDIEAGIRGLRLLSSTPPRHRNWKEGWESVEEVDQEAMKFVFVVADDASPCFSFLFLLPLLLSVTVNHTDLLPILVTVAVELCGFEFDAVGAAQQLACVLVVLQALQRRQHLLKR
jgi:hypothetical protein